jgi:hypothetical protein
VFSAHGMRVKESYQTTPIIWGRRIVLHTSGVVEVTGHKAFNRYWLGGMKAHAGLQAVAAALWRLRVPDGALRRGVTVGRDRGT